MIKMIVVDLDGTLLQSGFLSRRDADRMKHIQDKGIKLMVATGRNMRDAADYVEKLQLRQYGGAIALSDGQYLQDFSDQSMIEYGFLDYANDLRTILSLASVKVRHVQAFGKTRNYQVVLSAFSMFFIKCCAKAVMRRRYASKTLFANHEYQIDDIEKIILYAQETGACMEALSETYDVFYMHNRYEIKRKGVNKGAAVDAIREKYGYLSDEIAVFGNDENDVSMFGNYANSYAVSDAPESVKRKAKHIIPNGKVVDTIAALVEEGVFP